MNNEFEKALAREKNARRQAEEIVEKKTREIYEANQVLKEQVNNTEKQRNYYDAILNSLNEAIISADDSGKIITTNKSCLRIFGRQKQDLIGQQIETLFTKFMEKNDELITSEYTHPEGENRILETSCCEINADTSKEHVYIFRDITRREKAEKKRAELEHELQHAGKLEAIGQLAGGIAHEINTPIQYIGDNLRFIDESFEELKEILELYEKLENIPDKIKEEIEEADLEYLVEEIPTSIKQSLEGVAQVAKIVLAMKDFSHPSMKEKVVFDLHKAIQTTMTVCRNEWKNVATIETKFDENIHQILGLPGEFNQVFLNMIVNAAHAIKDAVEEGQLGMITISTEKKDDVCEIRINDTGTGIPEHAREKIFDPFFTTKGVGKGTGQGLAIIHDIITKKHGGQIHFETEMGKGTTFIITVPIGKEVKNG